MALADARTSTAHPSCLAALVRGGDGEDRRKTGANTPYAPQTGSPGKSNTLRGSQHQHLGGGVEPGLCCCSPWRGMTGSCDTTSSYYESIREQTYEEFPCWVK